MKAFTLASLLLVIPVVLGILTVDTPSVAFSCYRLPTAIADFSGLVLILVNVVSHLSSYYPSPTD